MPYDSTQGDPSFAEAMSTGNPRHLTRRRRSYIASEHMHTDALNKDGDAQLVLEENSDEHGSCNRYWKLSSPIPANCTVVLASDPRITWRYDRHSARQSARAYIEGLDHGTTVYVKQCMDLKDGSHRTTHPIPVELVPPKPNVEMPPGDVVALWNRRVYSGGNAAGILALLQKGDPICVY